MQNDFYGNYIFPVSIHNGVCGCTRAMLIYISFLNVRDANLSLKPIQMTVQQTKHVF